MRGVQGRGSGARGGGLGATQSVNGHQQCYAIFTRPEVESLAIAIVNNIPIRFRSISMLFNTG